MRYWWVNQNQTYKQEIQGGLSLVAEAERKRSTQSVLRGDAGSVAGRYRVFVRRHADRGHWVARSYCWESPKPQEFGSAGQNWENIGWKVKVLPLANQLRPKDHMSALGPVLPERYSPLQANGNGNQGVYLAELPAAFAEVLVGLIGSQASRFNESRRCNGCGAGHAPVRRRS